MLRDHSPLYLRRVKAALDGRFARHFLHPHFAAVGEGCTFTNPYYISVMGGPIELGRHVHMTGMRDNRVRLATWSVEPGKGHIRIGDYTVVNPGARISSGVGIDIGRDVVFASNVYITDCDWHGRYDRARSYGGYANVVIEDNVWLSEGVLVGKGVRVGRNSIVGAGSIVVHDVPDNCIAAGNPARVVRELDPSAKLVSRSDLLADPTSYYQYVGELQAGLLQGNTLRGYLRYLLFPRRGD